MANAGTGRATAEALVAAGAHVVMACRNLDKAEAARAEMADAVSGADTVVWLASAPALAGKTNGFYIDRKAKLCKFRESAGVLALWDLQERQVADFSRLAKAGCPAPQW